MDCVDTDLTYSIRGKRYYYSDAYLKRKGLLERKAEVEKQELLIRNRRLAGREEKKRKKREQSEVKERLKLIKEEERQEKKQKQVELRKRRKLLKWEERRSKKKERRVPEKLGRDDLFCFFGCGRKAKYLFGSGNVCCEVHHKKCPAVNDLMKEVVRKKKRYLKLKWGDDFNKIYHNYLWWQRYPDNYNPKFELNEKQDWWKLEESLREDDVVCCEECGTYYSSTYDQCPFCGDGIGNRMFFRSNGDPRIHWNTLCGTLFSGYSESFFLSLVAFVSPSSGDSYCHVWEDDGYKQYIFERDGYECINPLCRKNDGSRKLVRHHINYDKFDCSYKNIATVCLSCNSRANGNRDLWQAYYQMVMRRLYGYSYDSPLKLDYDGFMTLLES